MKISLQQYSQIYINSKLPLVRVRGDAAENSDESETKILLLPK